MTTITFGKLGDDYPVPALTTDTTDRTELAREIQDHARPHLTKALADMGRPELAGAFFHANADWTGGQFVHLDLGKGEGARFCGVRIAA